VEAREQVELVVVHSERVASLTPDRTPFEEMNLATRPNSSGGIDVFIRDAV
jgi:hypothetical protein